MAKAPSKKRPPKTSMRMTCSCAEQVNEQLKPYNTELDRSMSMSLKTGELSLAIRIATRKHDSKVRKPARTVIASFCPFCGVKF